MKIRWKVKTTSSAFSLREGKPRRTLKRNIIAQVKTVGCAVIQHFPAFRKLGHETVSVRVYIKQTIVKLRGKGIHNQAAARFCGLKVSTAAYAQTKPLSRMSGCGVCPGAAKARC